MSEKAFEVSPDEMLEQQLRQRGLKNERVLEAMRRVPRHVFVPESLRAKAYNDQPLPIGSGQTISQPYMVAVMTELLEIEAGQKVLEIGTGCGYQTAILSLLGCRVYSVEILPDLAEMAIKTLSMLGCAAHIKVVDGHLGWPEEAPFERIIAACADSEVPAALLDQLAPGGRLIMPVGPANQQQLVIVDKGMGGQLTSQAVMGVRFVPFVHAGP